MRLWSIQHQSAYDQLKKTGVLHANERFLFCTDDFRFAYKWLADQLQQRVGEPPAGVNYPIWAWYQWEGQHKRPDMRTHRQYGTKGTPIVLLTLKVPDELVLLSDFDMWHCVLNHGTASFSGNSDIAVTEEATRETWKDIFKWNESNSYWPEPKTTQAVLWELKKEWVIRAEHFISK